MDKFYFANLEILLLLSMHNLNFCGYLILQIFTRKISKIYLFMVLQYPCMKDCMTGITPEYPTHPTVLGLGLQLGLGLGIRIRVRDWGSA